MISDSAKTVQVLEMGTLFFVLSDTAPISSIGMRRRAAVTSRKRPVPAAHLSFIAKFATRPSAPTTMTLLS